MILGNLLFSPSLFSGAARYSNFWGKDLTASHHLANSFRPAFWLPGRHLQTILPTLLPGPPLGAVQESRLVEVLPGSRIRILISRPPGAARGTVILLHGLGGSADSGYLRRTARMALQRGWVAVRVNLRNCGGTEALSQTLYNAGQSEDAGRVLEELGSAGFPRPFGVVGFSLGGNLALRYAGLAGPDCRANAIVGVNPPVNLEACVKCLEEPCNSIYHAYFTWKLCRLLRRIRTNRPVPGPDPNPRAIRSVRRFDTLYTAPDGGFSSAEQYYRQASSGPHLKSLRVPTLVLSALNDPFVPAGIFDENGQAGSRYLRLLLPSSGGHVGYWQSGAPRFWAGKVALDFLEEATLPSGPSIS
ncbi:MAG: alpha/beta fold hydrolase [Acidobacteria bacterium]|nr:alpha/beta fold hydrolase [Acidobacteriota bacterium]MCI0567579.1 alpha/beta fold hydrolase [Acidobacteriota bacterium]